MGKIITGQELINIFKGCCSGQTENFADANYINGIQASMGLSNVENSGRCPAFNGNIDTVFNPFTFWYEMYGSDTAYDFVGSSQLEWTSGYLGLVNTQLVDSTYVPNFASQMRCTNLRYTGDFSFGVLTDGDYSGGFEIRVYIYFGSLKVLIASYDTNLSSGESDQYLSSDDINDIVFAGSSNIPSNSSTYTYEIEVSWETDSSSSDGSTYNITGLGCDVQSESGLMSGSIARYSATEGNGGSFTYRGQATFADIITINSVEIYGEWENEGGGSVYSTLRIGNCYLRTNSTSVVYISGATSTSTIQQNNVNLYSPNLTELSTPLYLVAEDIANGEIGVQFPGQYIGSTTGSFLLPLTLAHNNYYYKLYIPVTIISDGSVTLRSSECYLDLSSVSYNGAVTYRLVYNNRTTPVTYRPLISSGVSPITLGVNSNKQTSPLLSTTHVYPSSGTMNVKVSYNTTTSPTSTSMASATVATGVSNTTVNLIPSNLASNGLLGIIQRIASSSIRFTVTFE